MKSFMLENKHFVKNISYSVLEAASVEFPTRENKGEKLQMCYRCSDNHVAKIDSRKYFLWAFFGFFKDNLGVIL